MGHTTPDFLPSPLLGAGTRRPRFGITSLGGHLVSREGPELESGPPGLEFWPWGKAVEGPGKSRDPHCCGEPRRVGPCLEVAPQMGKGRAAGWLGYGKSEALVGRLRGRVWWGAGPTGCRCRLRRPPGPGVTERPAADMDAQSVLGENGQNFWGS